MRTDEGKKTCDEIEYNMHAQGLDPGIGKRSGQFTGRALGLKRCRPTDIHTGAVGGAHACYSCCLHLWLKEIIFPCFENACAIRLTKEGNEKRGMSTELVHAPMALWRQPSQD